VLAYEDVVIDQPGAGEIVVRNQAIGVNFVDTYLRSGAFTPLCMPFIPGKEGAGEVLAIGEGVHGVAPGDRVAYVETLEASWRDCHRCGRLARKGRNCATERL
jgi:NADPH2:quinone reductase